MTICEAASRSGGVAPKRGRPANGGMASGRSVRAWRYVETLVCAAFGVSAAQLRDGRRCEHEAVLARQAAMYLAHVGLGLSYVEVAAHFGRDRTTVAHACARIEDRRDEPRHARLFDCLETAVGHWRWSLRDGGVAK